MDTLLNEFRTKILLEYDNNNNIVQGVILDKNKIIDNLQQNVINHEKTIDKLNIIVEDLSQECKNYENVSIHKNLSKQISEKDNEIRILNNRLSTFERKYATLNKKYESIILQNKEVEE